MSMEPTKRNVDKWREWFYGLLVSGVREDEHRMIFRRPILPPGRKKAHGPTVPDWAFLDDVLPRALATEELRIRKRVKKAAPKKRAARRTR